MDMAPITLGCKDNADSLRGLVIMVRGTRGQYIVPLSCPEKRYKVPSGSKAWIRDVLLNKTGAMSLSSMCSLAWSKGYRYNWTRCDWVPKVFIGGHVFFTGEKVRNNVAIVDFTSMYPSIIKDGGISPECIDFIDMSDRYTPRFDYVEVVYTYKHSISSNKLSVGVIAMGINRSENTDA